MKISGCTIARNITKYNYPILESINSILPVCDEFIINVGDSEDDTLDIVRSIKDPKVRIIQNKWDLSEGKAIVLDEQTETAMSECVGDWIFYLQADEVIHENDLKDLVNIMGRYVDDDNIEALRMNWLNFFGSYFRYRIDKGWVQKQDRILKNTKRLKAVGGAYGFANIDDAPLKRKRINKLLYHYGWVQSPETMAQRRINAEQIGYVTLTEDQRAKPYDFGDLQKFPVYFGSHPKVMHKKIEAHELTKQEREFIEKKFWWYPPKIFKIRYKTFRRDKRKIDWY